MEPHDLLTLAATKAVEYVVAIVSLLLFVPFWRYLDRPARSRPARALPEADGPGGA